MGLDLVLYKKNKSDNISMEEEFDDELAYGRKTWAIADFFMDGNTMRKEDEYDFSIDEEDWDDFISCLRPYFHNDEFCNFIENYYSEEDTYGHLYDLIEYFMDITLGQGAYGNYQLGADWEARAALQWYRADKEVKEAFKNDEEVRLLVDF